MQCAPSADRNKEPIAAVLSKYAPFAGGKPASLLEVASGTGQHPRPKPKPSLSLTLTHSPTHSPSLSLSPTLTLTLTPTRCRDCGCPDFAMSFGGTVPANQPKPWICLLFQARYYEPSP